MLLGPWDIQMGHMGTIQEPHNNLAHLDQLEHLKCHYILVLDNWIMPLLFWAKEWALLQTLGTQMKHCWPFRTLPPKIPGALLQLPVMFSCFSWNTPHPPMRPSHPLWWGPSLLAPSQPVLYVEQRLVSSPVVPHVASGYLHLEPRRTSHLLAYLHTASI